MFIYSDLFIVLIFNVTSYTSIITIYRNKYPKIESKVLNQTYARLQILN